MTETTAAYDAKVQDLVDKQEIREALARYCRGVDRCDPSLINSAFHPDAVDEHAGHGNYVGEAIGPNILEFIRSHTKGSSHNITNQIVRVDGDTAASETYYLVWQLETVNEEELILESHGRYIDRFERRNGEWKIAHRRIISDIAAYLRPEQIPGRIRLGLGRRDRTDLSYEVLGD
jgi:hypothetical protein